jgi:hypothetical protein
MLKKVSVALLTFLLIAGNAPAYALSGFNPSVPQDDTGTLEKMIVASGSVAMDLNLTLLNGAGVSAKVAQPSVLRFDVERDSFFTVLVFNNELRGPLPSSMSLSPQDFTTLPARLTASYNDLVIENRASNASSTLVVSDKNTGFIFFNIEGYVFDYDSNGHLLKIEAGRLVISKEFAASMGRPSSAGSVVGQISMTATMRAIEIIKVVNGQATSNVMPALREPDSGSVPGPDVVVGDVSGLQQFGSSSGTRVGLAVGTDSCNFGVQNLHWFANPDNDHPVIPQNLYRMSGGATNDERFEQIGQSNVKHAFTALTDNICGLGCNGVGGSNLGSGCSDPYSASLNSGPNLGSRAWINPFTGAYPRNDSMTPNNSHSGHAHNGTSHRILTEISDLNTSVNVGATYYAEGQYVTPHEYAWCQSNPGQCNMNNNVSYRRFNVSGTGSPFAFSPVGSTQRAKAAIVAWTGATLVQIQPDAANDGIGTVGYKVTNPSPGVWHYEYAVYNQNLDRAIQSFSVPVGAGVTVSNIGFHAPPQHPGWTGDGTVGNAGYSSAPWAQTLGSGAMLWNSETFAQNQNANALRWGTLYNFRFDSNRPPATMNATVGFFKTGAPITVQIQGPSAAAAPVSVTGRLTNPSGQGVNNVQIAMTDSGGITRSTLTSSLGYYTFTNVVAGGTYTFAISSKRFTMTPQVIQINDNVSNMDFVVDPIGGRMK